MRSLKSSFQVQNDMAITQYREQVTSSLYGMVQWMGKYETDVYSKVAESLMPDGITEPSNTATC